MLKTVYLLALIVGICAAQEKPAQLAEGWDLIPGEKLLLYDDFTDMTRGGQPPHWKVRGASVKLAANGALIVTDETRLWPNIAKWPNNFTIEQEIVIEKGEDTRDIGWNFGAGEDWQWRVWMRFNGDDEGTCSANVELADGGDGGSAPCKYEFGKPYKVSLWVQDGRVRVYFGNTRLIDLNQVKTGGFPAAWVEVSAGASAMTVRNFRIAESSPDFSKTIMASGRFVTHGIQFDVNSDRLKPESAPVLKMIAGALSADPKLKLRIEGHTDSTGDAAKNLELSKRRAESVKAALVSQYGLAADRLSSEGLGATKPIAPNDTPQGRADNRRVEFVKL